MRFEGRRIIGKGRSGGVGKGWRTVIFYKLLKSGLMGMEIFNIILY